MNFQSIFLTLIISASLFASDNTDKITDDKNNMEINKYNDDFSKNEGYRRNKNRGMGRRGKMGKRGKMGNRMKNNPSHGPMIMKKRLDDMDKKLDIIIEKLNNSTNKK